MNLLLLLSALLSALTGLGGSVRTPEQAQAIAAISVERPVATIAAAYATSRPMQVLVPLVAVTSLGVCAVATIVPAVPRWIDRRRE